MDAGDGEAIELANVLERRSSLTMKNIPSIQSVKFNNLNFVGRRLADNRINNQRYSTLSFIPMVLFDQFKFFFNMFFLAVCLS